VIERNGPEGLALVLECDDDRRWPNATAPRCYLFWIRTICRWFVIVGSTHSGRFSRGLLLSDIAANQVFGCSDRRIPAAVVGGDLNGLGVCRSLAAGGMPVWVVDTKRSNPARFQESGFGGIEYKRDARDGRFLIIEPTVGRTDWQEEVATLAGVNIPLMACRHELGLGTVET
jgi:hypothetical protein